jgi:hypothetical protein
MAEMFDLLKPEKDHNDDPIYSGKHIRELATVVVNLEGQGLLAVLEDGIHISFAVFRWEQGSASGDPPDEWYQRVFHGSGPSGSLRELRHTYWGETDNSGYIFYAPGKLIADAFKQLERWFDVDHG